MWVLREEHSKSHYLSRVGGDCTLRPLTGIPPPPVAPVPIYTLQAARVSPLTISAWNVWSLLENPRNNRSEQLTSLVAQELTRHKVDIAALSETCFSEQVQLEELGAGYIFFCSGRTKAKRRDAGVVFAIRNILGNCGVYHRAPTIERWP
ncbi:hypothetical protein SprV_0301221900 [Sparganum proliferum]